jgi:hypothetical protein
MKRTLGDTEKTNKKTCFANDNIEEFLSHLENGDYQYCLSQKKHDDDVVYQLLENITQRQWRLETDNRRLKLALRQQHHLLTCNDENVHPETVSNVQATTPEDSLESFREKAFIERVELSSPGKKPQMC